MNKLTAEKCREQFEQWFRDVEAGDDDNWSSPPYLSREWHDYLARRQLALGAWNKALDIALPILEQQEMITDSQPVITDNAEMITDSAGLGEWIEWKGGDQPVSDYSMVEVKFRNGSVEKGEFAECYEWNHGYHDLSTTEVDIIAYRIIPDRATNQNGEQ